MEEEVQEHGFEFGSLDRILRRWIAVIAGNEDAAAKGAAASLEEYEPTAVIH